MPVAVAPDGDTLRAHGRDLRRGRPWSPLSMAQNGCGARFGLFLAKTAARNVCRTVCQVRHPIKRGDRRG